MKIPACCELSIVPLTHAGPHRPKFFLHVKLAHKDGVEYSQYVRGIPLLLRVRLWLAVSRCKRMHRKLDKFLENIK